MSDEDILQEKNRSNIKVKDYLTSAESKKLFQVAMLMLKEVSFNSKEADIIIAGVAIWSMTREDDKYFDWHKRNTPETSPLWRLRDTRCYPNKTLYDIEQICNIHLNGYLSNSDIQNSILIIGSRALNERDLGFDGAISAFQDNTFLKSDWSGWTDRFDKYHLQQSMLKMMQNKSV